MKIRCCAFCGADEFNKVQEIEQINLSNMFYCETHGFITLEDTVMLIVQTEE